MTSAPALNTNEARNRNLAAVFEAVRDGTGRSRSEIGAEMPFSLQTMTNVTQELIDMGLLVEGEHAGGRRKGNPHRGLRIVATRHHALGVQIRWNSCTLALVDLDRRRVDQRHAPIEVEDGDAEGYLAALEQAIDGFLAAHADKAILTMAVSGPLPIVAPNELAHVLTRLPPLEDQRWFRKFWARTTVADLRTRLARRHDRPVTILNNPQAAAFAEALALPPAARFIYLLAGLALGAAFVSGRAINRDFWRHGGEIGHVVHDGTTLSALLSASGVRHAVGLDRPQGAFEPALAQMAIDTPQVFDPWLDRAAPILRFVVNFLENAMWPDGIVLGGFLPDALLDRLIARTGPLTDSVVAPDGADGRRMPRLVRAGQGADRIASGAAASLLSHRSSDDFAGLLATLRRR